MNPLKPIKSTIAIVISRMITTGCINKYRLSFDLSLRSPIYAMYRAIITSIKEKQDNRVYYEER